MAVVYKSQATGHPSN